MDMESLRTAFFGQNGILAWIVCLGMLISNMIVQGINNAFGAIISTIITEFNSDLASVALIPSIHSSAYYFSGFICSILVKWYSFRSLVFIGGVGSCIAFIASFYSSNITSLTVAYGVLGGMGNGLVYVPGLIACGFYFDDNKRALATGIATSGSGVGIVVIPLLVNYVNENFGWRSSMLLLSSISPIICLVALAMSPLSTNSSNSTQISLPQDIETVENGINNNNVQDSDLKKETPANEKRKGIFQMEFGFDISNFTSQIKQYLTDSWDLLKQPKLLAYCLSHGLFTVGYFIPIDFLSTMMVEDHGISAKQAGYIIPIIGAATCIGKLLTGSYITKLKLNALGVHALYLIGCGICCFLFTFCTLYSEFVGVAVLYGLVVGPIDMMIMECLTKMFGIELVKDTVGFVMLVYAMGAAIGAPVGGWLYEVANNFDGVFYFAGAIYLVAALSGCIALFLNRKYEQITAQYNRL